jgi:hypothetical protein
MLDVSKLSTVPVDQWINEWMEREPSSEYRGCMVFQLYMIRKKHGRESSKEYRNHIKELGHYPTKNKTTQSSQ